MVKFLHKFICFLFGHNYLLLGTKASGRGYPVAQLYCSRCGKEELLKKES